ncbi:hypothetical protein COY27_05955 [Candidatus Woesearchaeota archaeon CG_4_10_14_0_2_um_filter_33_13]|nr:MAG: hypothetical protein COY27_05955 [Candidatus Woesearchaeota archaeon CG_4_10_14_0_2_um_filter_33_13]
MTLRYNMNQNKLQNISELIDYNFDKKKNGLALINLANSEERYTYTQFKDEVEKVAKILIGIGVKKTDRCAIFSFNCPKWVIVDLAIQKLGAVSVPLYWRSTPNEIEYIVNLVNPKVIFFGDMALARVFQSLKTKTQLHSVLFSEEKEKGTLNWSSFCSLKGIDNVERVSENDLARIVFTSGSTGAPKGVMLTHKNLIYEAFALSKGFKINPSDIFLSYLPLNHMFGLAGEVYTPILAGAEINFSNDPKAAIGYLSQVKPTIFLSVPFVLEKVCKNSLQKLSFLGLEEKLMQLTERRPPFAYNWLLNYVGKKIKQKFGGQIRCLIVGGAHLSRDVEIFFKHTNIPLYQGYGMTEAAPVIAVNTPGHSKIFSVGNPFDKIKISKDGEILVKGENVMSGYFKDETKTLEVLQHGWLHTGDLGKVDHYGHLFIYERKDDLIVLSTGKNINPLPIEEKLEELFGIFKAVVYGNKKPYLVAVLFVSGNINVDYEKKVVKHLQLINAYLPHYERVVKYKLLSAKDLEGSKSLKVSRKKIINEQREVLEQLYLQN